MLGTYDFSVVNSNLLETKRMETCLPHIAPIEHMDWIRNNNAETFQDFQKDYLTQWANKHKFRTKMKIMETPQGNKTLLKHVSETIKLGRAAGFVKR